MTSKQDNNVECNLCNDLFTSKTKLFHHLCISHGWENPKYDYLMNTRCVVLIGWLSSFYHEKQEIFKKDDSLKSKLMIDDIEVC